METKENRDLVWNRNRQYMDGKHIAETARDLLPLCQRCENWMGDEHDYEECRNQPCMELWLSNEYNEWCNSWRNDNWRIGL